LAGFILEISGISSEGPEISFFKLFVTIETVDKRIKQIKVTVDV
jgi:hypothetical protein